MRGNAAFKETPCEDQWLLMMERSWLHSEVTEGAWVAWMLRNDECLWRQEFGGEGEGC